MHDKQHAAAHLGTELRRARQRCRMRQSDVAARIDRSQSTISRMELGGGAYMPLAVWAAAAGAVGRRLVVDLVDTRPDVPQEASLALRCHRTITNEARVGGWSAVTEIRSRPSHEEIETVLARASESVVVHVWDVVTRVAARLEILQASCDRERSRADAASVCGLVVVPSTHSNRRRMTEEQALLQEAVPTLAAHWYATLRHKHRPVPIDTGVLWLDRHGDRLLPAPLLPGWIWVTPDHGSRILW
ncbi:MAG TPA: helix-turn-helix domain-containing protein [Candidatus Limnocylindrales bacterium]|nr:helix-turn-helix domain-containing protein [Candidatus Limnocylindrales bacterium]